MVTDVSESRLVMLFTEALTKPLRRWVKAYKSSTLQYFMSRTRDSQGSIPKNRFMFKTNFPIRDKDKKPFQLECSKKIWMDDDIRKELRRN